MIKIADGNTAVGVNQRIIDFLLSREQLTPGFLNKALDLPCGEGKFMVGLKDCFPGVQVQGKDLYSTPIPEAKPFFFRAGVDRWETHQPGEFDLITCISGVMVFDDLDRFFNSCSSHLKDDGWLIVTNDNVMTLRDRLSWLLWGRLRRFKKFYDLHEGNWNVVLIQALVRLLQRNNLTIEKIEYVNARWEDWIFAPLAVVLYPLQLWTLRKAPPSIPMNLRRQMFSWQSFFARHYVIYAQKRTVEKSQ
jgi:hypothetical protein